MKAEVVSIGRELLMGDTADTNATFLARQLSLLGIELVWVSQVGDSQPQIVEVLRRGWERSDLILTTGGLGPTADDLTRESVAELMSEQMAIDPALEHDLRDRFGRLGMRDMPQSNLKQCTLIPSASALPNPQGTAPGWWVEKNSHLLVCMPGPPREMNYMWENQVRGRLQEKSGTIIVTKTWKTFGLSEGAVGEMAFPLFPGENPSLGVYAKPDGIQLQLKVTADTEEQAERQLAEGETRIEAVLGPHIWGTNEDTLEAAIGRLLLAAGHDVAVMEDYSGGWLATGLNSVQDCDAFFRGGLVVPTDGAKVAFGIPEDLIERHGSASADVGVAMAEAARRYFSASVGIGVTGISADGFAQIAIDMEGRTYRSANRPRGRQRLATAALFELRKQLLEQ